MSAIPPDYDSDPDRRGSWKAPQDVHDMVGPELDGPVLDVGSGEGRLANRLRPHVDWFGVDSSETQLTLCLHRPVVRADMRALPFRSGAFTEVTHLWCLYHLADPVAALEEAKRVLRERGRYYASTGARNSDPELMSEGYPPSSFDAEEAVEIVGSVFDEVLPERWDARFFPLESRDEIRAYCRHSFIPEERAESVEIPLWLTKRGVLVRAVKQ
jgi:SAM-dependent methyltransferase